MSEPTHLCLDCELAKRESFTTLRTDGGCATCGSKSVLDLLVAKAAFAATKTPSTSANRRPATLFDSNSNSVDCVVRETSPTRVDALSAQAKRKRELQDARIEDFNKPIRAFLRRAKRDDLNTWWDGHFASVQTSIWARKENEVPQSDELDWVELELCCRNGEAKLIRFNFDPSDESQLVVEAILKERKAK